MTCDGVVLIDKPAGRSSAGAADDARVIFGAARGGHGGTLDPMATGVLVVCLGEATKLATYLLADDKAYEADVALGVETDTLDRTGAVVAERDVPEAALAPATIEAALARFRGPQLQTPPMYSAIKQGGVKLYQRARRGEEVERAPRAIRIDRLELLAIDPVRRRFRIAIACSKGTYVRSLVADLGTALGPGAHLAELRRTRSGAFAIADASTLDQLRACTPEARAARLIPLARAITLPAATIADPEVVRRCRNGVRVPPTALFTTDPTPPPQFQLLDGAGALIAVVHTDPADGLVRFDRVFKP